MPDWWIIQDLAEKWHVPPSVVRDQPMEDYVDLLARRLVQHNLANVQRLGESDETIAEHNPESPY